MNLNILFCFFFIEYFFHLSSQMRYHFTKKYAKIIYKEMNLNIVKYIVLICKEIWDSDFLLEIQTRNYYYISNVVHFESVQLLCFPFGIISYKYLISKSLRLINFEVWKKNNSNFFDQTSSNEINLLEISKGVSQYFRK